MKDGIKIGRKEAYNLPLLEICKASLQDCTNCPSKMSLTKDTYLLLFPSIQIHYSEYRGG